jgi:lipopolysaccharide export system permease protein
MIKKIDRYIIQKFLGTFFFSIVLIISIAVIFDFSEKVDDFHRNQAPFSAIVFDYYLNFIPYFIVLFSNLFVFISVIFFTSKMAYDTEIIAILSSGVSFRRFLWPYFLSSLVIVLLTFYLTNYVIPGATEKRFVFEEYYYYDNPVHYNARDIHKQINPGVYIYMESYSTMTDIGRRFSMEKFDEGKLKSKLMSDYIRWDSTMGKWVIHNYYIRNFVDGSEELIKGHRVDTTLNMDPSDFRVRANVIETMTLPELNEFIEERKMQGAESITYILIEKHKRFAIPFSTFILALIGVCISSKKIRGGIGMHIGAGLLLAFSYILFMQFSSQFAIGGSIPPAIAAWIPNMLYAFVGFYLYKKAAK